MRFRTCSAAAPNGHIACSRVDAASGELPAGAVVHARSPALSALSSISIVVKRSPARNSLRRKSTGHRPQDSLQGDVDPPELNPNLVSSAPLGMDVTFGA